MLTIIPPSGYTGPMPVIAFDFDGVLVDSAPEIRHTALCAWSRLEHGSDLEQRFASDSGLAERLDQLIPLGNRAEDFGVACRILAEDAPISTQDEYDAFKADMASDWLDRFHHTFYACRNAVRDDHPEAWFELHRTYPGVLESLRRAGRRHTYAIATAKDRHSVAILLEHHGAGDLFDPDLIFDKETGVDKTAHLSAVARATGAPLRDLTFVDDKVNHLLRVAPLGVRSVLASWGHNSHREHREAAEAGFPVATLESFESIVLA